MTADEVLPWLQEHVEELRQRIQDVYLETVEETQNKGGKPANGENPGWATGVWPEVQS